MLRSHFELCAKMLHFTLVVICVCASLASSASVYNKSLKNSRIKRHNEIFDETFLPGNSVQHSVPRIAQTLPFTCGPTVVLSMLQFWGDRSLANDISGPISGDLCADGLIMRMETEHYSPLGGGTHIGNFVNTLNNRIRDRNLNSGRQYTAVRLRESIMNRNVNSVIDYTNQFWRIARDVYNSLVNRAPVVLGFSGRFSGFESIRSHFILISGITITENGATFSYMDPDGGVQRTFEHHQLNHLLENGGFLIFHRPEPTVPKTNKNCPKAAAYSGTAGTLGGAVSGAIVGSAVPIVGTLVGGLAGAATGLVVGIVSGGAACAL